MIYIVPFKQMSGWKRSRCPDW